MEAPAPVVRRYTFKLYPNAAQRAELDRQAKMHGELWNALLAQRIQQWAHECQRRGRADRKGLTAYDQSKDITKLRAACPEWRALCSGSLQQTAFALDHAFKAFFRRAKAGAGASSGYPKFRRTDDYDTVPFRENGKGWRWYSDVRKHRIYIKNVPGMVKARGKFPGEPACLKTMNLMRREGDWFISIVAHMPARMVAGDRNLQVDFDLLDEFASVKDANGECVAGLSQPFMTAGEGEITHNGNGLEAGSCGEPAIVGDAQAMPIGDPGRTACGEPAFVGDAQALAIATTDKVPCGEPAIVGDADEIQSSRDRRFRRFSYRWKREKRRIARIKAREARQRREALHKWTTRIVRSAAALTVVAPRISEHTASGRGDERNWGAAVEPIAKLNRHVLAQAPAAAIQMLAYKAAEAGIAFEERRPVTPKIAVGRDLKATATKARKARRTLKKEAA